MLRHLTIRLIALTALLLGMTSCTSFAESADAAYLRGDWEAAVADYAQAVASATESAEVARLRSRLAECRTNAGAQCLAKARNHIGAGDSAMALQSAERAFQYSPTEEVQLVVRSLRAQEGSRLLQEGAVAFKQERWTEAVANLEKAQQLAPSGECTTLLAQARSALQEQRHASFDEFRSVAEAALRERQWSKAAAKYEAAHAFGEDAESRKASAFAKCMAEAGTMFASQPRDAFRLFKLTSKYEEALEMGLDQDYVRERIQAVQPASYRITINDAVILPFKPSSKTPWDGPANPVAGAGPLLSELGGMLEVSQPHIAVMRAIAKYASTGIGEPDCYVSVSIGEKTFENRASRAENSLHPTWQYAITFPSTNVFDARILHIRVLDADLTDDDDIGTHQISLGELVQRTGAHTYTLFDEKGKLASGGLLTLTVTVERQ